MSRKFNHRRYTRRHLRHNPFSESNLHNSYDFRRKNNKKKIFYWIIFFVVLLFLFVNYGDEISVKVKSIQNGESKIIPERSEELIEQRIFELVNEERQRVSIIKLKSNNRLEGLAKQHSISMIEQNFLNIVMTMLERILEKYQFTIGLRVVCLHIQTIK